IDGAGYAEVVRDLLLFLEGKKADLIARLSAEMAAAAAGRDFEKALELRDRIESLSSVPITRKRYRIVDQVEELRSVLRLKQSPARIEGYDISHISGSEPVGSMVCFRQGNPFKKEYRRFKIKTIEGIDDYAMIREVLRRRFSGTLKDRLELPQLILIDGGLGHLQSARQELEAAGVPVPVISIAKRFEHIYVEWQDEPLALARDSRALHLLMRVRDEAHRFALAYHRNLRKKNMLLSELDQIPGIGEKRRQILQRLLQAHPDTRRLTAQQIINSGGIDEKTAKNIIEHWNKY
ncbi:MAG: UvrB/UvrC motif-containing protein, partial [Candidatus Omnitrophica bacterium]|nr:UvrB/UvrC motif-containing protein [Candidatus Omnitrophota bacterium]